MPSITFATSESHQVESNLNLGLILNFNVPVMKDGIVRVVNNLEE